MVGRSVILQKKLQELESELGDVFGLPVDPTPSAAPRLQLAFDDIYQRFIFLNNLLRQEIASQPHNSDQLRLIGTRLAALEAAFRQWNDWRMSSVCSDCTQALLLRAEESGSPVPDPPENFSGETSSPEKIENVDRENCGQVVPYDDDDDDGDVRSDRILDSENVCGEKGENVRKEEEEEKVWRKMGKYGGAFGCGMIVGAICMVRLLFLPSSSSSHHFIEYDSLFLPPT